MQNLRTRIKTWYFVRINVSVGHITESNEDSHSDKTFTYTTLVDKLSQDIANAEASTELFVAQMGLNFGSITSDEINNISAQNLYYSSSMYISSDELMRRLNEKHPEWNGANWGPYIDRLWERGGRTSTRGRVEDAAIDRKRDIVNAAMEALHRYEGDIKSLLFYQVTSLQKIQAGEKESELWEGFADKYHNVQWGGFGNIPDFVKVDASEIAQEARRLYRANIYQFVDQVESQMSVNRREIKRLAEPNFAGTGVAVYSDYVSSLAPEVNHGLARLFCLKNLEMLMLLMF